MEQIVKFLQSDEFSLSKKIINTLNKDNIDEIILIHFSKHSNKCNDFTKKLMKQFLKHKLDSACMTEHLYKG